MVFRLIWKNWVSTLAVDDMVTKVLSSQDTMSSSSMKKDSYMCHFSMEECYDVKIQIYAAT